MALPFHWAWARPFWRRLVAASPAVQMPSVAVAERGDGPVPLRLYQPQDGATGGSDAGAGGAALLWFHGGGWMFGDPRMDDARCSALVRETGMTVVSPRYRLAPEHRFPAALQDAHAAWTWLQGVAEDFGVDPSRVAVGGASAGAGLAACLAQRVRDEGGRAARAQVLLYPMLDDATAARRDLDGAGHLVWSNRANRAGWRAYLGTEPGADDVPAYAVARRCRDLSGLPPTWIGVGTLDLFLHECRAYADRLEQAGSRVERVEVAGAPHGFDALRPDAEPSRSFAASYTDFLRHALELDRGTP